MYKTLLILDAANYVAGACNYTGEVKIMVACYVVSKLNAMESHPKLHLPTEPSIG